MIIMTDPVDEFADESVPGAAGVLNARAVLDSAIHFNPKK